MTNPSLRSPEATLLQLGLTSAMGIALKGWVVREMEAELTTFQMLKQPLRLVVESIGEHTCPPRQHRDSLFTMLRASCADLARRETVGAAIPAMPNPS